MATEQIQLFERFVGSISSPGSTPPSDTILGAITQFFCTLPLEHCTRLIREIGSSTTLWSSAASTASTREAIRLGVAGAVARVSSEAKERERWYSVKIGRSCPRNKWAQAMLDEAKRSDRKGDFLVALLGGAHAHLEQRGSQDAISKGLLRELQEETVLALAPRLDTGPGEDKAEAYAMLSEVLHVIDSELLCLLDLPVSRAGRILSRAVT